MSSMMDGSRSSNAQVSEVLSLREAAAFLKVHPNTVRAYVTTGRLPGRKIGGWRFLRTDLEAFLRGDYGGPAQVQPSAQRKESRKWHSTSVRMGYGMSKSQFQAENLLDALLAPKTGKRRKSTTTGKRSSSGTSYASA